VVDHHHRAAAAVEVSSFVIISRITNFWILPLTVIG
jgi:hypothetical protein